MVDENKPNQSGEKSQVYVTDDSGVVIPLEQWVELHGESQKHKIESRLHNIPFPNIPLPKRMKGIFKPNQQNFAKKFKVDKVQPSKTSVSTNQVTSDKAQPNKVQPDKTSVSTKQVTLAKIENAGLNKQVKEIRCKICKTVTSIETFKDHLQKKHLRVYEAITKKEVDICPICDADLIYPARFKRHLSEVHHITLSSPKSKSTKLIQTKHQMKHDKNQKQIEQPQLSSDIVPDGQEGNIAEAFRQAFDEKRDGSKGLGHMRRESDGKFGSFPLHDDYSDESKSD